MRREDYPAFKIAREFLPREEFKEWLKLPYLYISANEREAIRKHDKTASDEYYEDTKLTIEEVITYWDDFILTTHDVVEDGDANNPESEYYIAFYGARFKLCEDEQGSYLEMTVFCDHGFLTRGGYKITVAKKPKVTIQEHYLGLETVSDMYPAGADWIGVNLIEEDIPKAEQLEFSQRLLRVMYQEYIAVYNYVYYSDLYFTEQRSLKPKKKRGGVLSYKSALRRWEGTGPSILVLNKLPTERENKEEGVGHTVRYHQRRGHFKTLRHEKYRHHPKYLVENGIYVKPTWVGEQEGEYRGNSYKVLLPPKEF